MHRVTFIGPRRKPAWERFCEARSCLGAFAFSDAAVIENQNHARGFWKVSTTVSAGQRTERTAEHRGAPGRKVNITYNYRTQVGGEVAPGMCQFLCQFVLRFGASLCASGRWSQALGAVFSIVCVSVRF